MIQLLDVLSVYTYMNVLLPLPPGLSLEAVKENETARFNLSAHIVESSIFPDDWAILTRIARWESNYDPRVLDCRIKSSIGAAGPFQVLPRSKKEKEDLCSDHTESARLALMRIGESRRQCYYLPKAEQLAQYATGNCGETGRMLSRMRYSNENIMYKVINE